MAYPGRHEFILDKLPSYEAIPIIDVKYPPNQGLRKADPKSHDIAMYVLKHPAHNIRPICLPSPGEKFAGKIATAAGWGTTKRDHRSRQSPVLRKVDLEVSDKLYDHRSMFGTLLKKNGNGLYKDLCAGDSGTD